MYACLSIYTYIYTNYEKEEIYEMKISIELF